MNTRIWVLMFFVKLECDHYSQRMLSLVCKVPLISRVTYSKVLITSRIEYVVSPSFALAIHTITHKENGVFAACVHLNGLF